MKIEMGRVKCGDCFVISSGEEKLIVDCGSSNKGKIAYNELKKMVCLGINSSLMISHFDEDHYNGILEISEKNIFDEIYISAYLPKNKKAIKILGCLIALSKKNDAKFDYFDNISKLFLKIPSLLGQNGKIIPVKANTDIFVGNDKFVAIWPEIDSNNINLNYDQMSWEAILEMLSSLEIRYNELNKENEQRYSNKNLIYLKIKEAIDNFSNSLEKYFDFFFEGKNSDYFEKVQELEKTLNNLYEIKQDINAFYSEIEVLIKDKENRNIPSSFEEEYKNFAKNINNQYKNLINDINSTSIIMHKENEILFLGDAPPKIIKHLIKSNLIQKKYIVIKVQHHGTKKYFFQDMPKANFYLIPNGGHSKRKIHTKFIEYADFICCSNAWENPDYCEYYLNHQRCSQKCIKDLLYIKFSYRYNILNKFILCRGCRYSYKRRMKFSLRFLACKQLRFSKC